MRGNNGGHRLAKEPSEYVIGDILRVIEGNFAPVDCVASDSGIDCPQSSSCATYSFWKGLDDVVNEYVDSYTLQDLLDGKAK